MNISPERVWNTWSASDPGAFVHAASGLCVRVSLYNGDLNRFEDFHGALRSEQASVEFGRHDLEGNHVAMVLRLATNHLDVAIEKRSPFSFVGRVALRERSTWRPHLWINLELGYLWQEEQPAPDNGSDGSAVHILDADAGFVRIIEGDPPLLGARWRSQEFRLSCSAAPTHLDTYPAREDLQFDYEQRGSWFVRAGQALRAGWGAFRFNAESVFEFDFCLVQAADRAEATASARDAARELASSRGDLVSARTSFASENTSVFAPLEAVRDVVAWNSVYGPRDRRVYTCLTRNWMKMLGGWGYWLTDVLYNAFLAAVLGDFDLARSNTDAVLFGQQSNGLIPGLMAGSTEWVDRTQFPVPAYMVWRTYLLTGDKHDLEHYYPILVRYQEWQFRERDGNGNGLLEHGSKDVGMAPNAGTRWAAINESGMDNLPVFDDAVYRHDTHTLDFEEVGHNSMLALSFELLSEMARELGRQQEADALGKQRDRLAALIQEHLWDDSRQIFAGRRWSGDFAVHLSPTSFMPLLAGVATPEQADVVVARHLLNEAEFWGELVVPSVPRDDPVARDDAYWRGRIWPPLNFMTWDGLRRYGYDREAREVARRSWELFQVGWEHRHSHENFSMWDASGCELPDSDEFYSWGALMPLMSVLERADANPWRGITLEPMPHDQPPLSLAGARFSLRQWANGMVLSCGGAKLATIEPRTRVEHISYDSDHLRFTLAPPSGADSVAIHLERALGRRLLAAFVDGEAIAAETDEATSTIRVTSGAPRRVEVYLRTAKG